MYLTQIERLLLILILYKTYVCILCIIYVYYAKLGAEDNNPTRFFDNKLACVLYLFVYRYPIFLNLGDKQVQYFYSRHCSIRDACLHKHRAISIRNLSICLQHMCLSELRFDFDRLQSMIYKLD